MPNRLVFKSALSISQSTDDAAFRLERCSFHSMRFQSGDMADLYVDIEREVNRCS